LPEFAVDYPEEAGTAVKKIDGEIASLKLAAEAVAAQSKRDYRSTVNSLKLASQNLVAAESQIRGSDYAQEEAVSLKLQMQHQSDMAATSLGSLSSDVVFKLLHA
jgi:flagellin-like hook-associated protein FlgL